jgi:hypothetical protein
VAAIINIDFSRFKTQFSQIIDALKDHDSTLRPVAVELTGIMSGRIHEDGLASDGTQIGKYSSNYLKVREAKKLGPDPNVILVLTRKLSNSWGAFATERGWAVGFVDDSAVDGVTSRKKIEFAEVHFKKKILDMTVSEEEYAEDRLIELINQALEPYASP